MIGLLLWHPNLTESNDCITSPYVFVKKVLIMDHIKHTCCCWSLKGHRKDKWPVTSLNWCVWWIFSSSKVSSYIFPVLAIHLNSASYSNWMIYSPIFHGKKSTKCFCSSQPHFPSSHLNHLKGGAPNTLTATVSTLRRSQHLSQTLRKGTTSKNTTGQAWGASPS